MNEQDLQVFVNVGVNFFEKTTGEKALLQSGRLRFGRSHLLDYSGLIRIGGSSSGIVCLTASRPMLADLLRATGEDEESEEMFRDLVGEIASILASNARKHFGPQFQIALPEVLPGAASNTASFPYTQLEFPIEWRAHRASLILALTETGALPVTSFAA